tara:strand:+ start:9335 stop:10579 length:1245 start_codon:yes stop_codon:yes gene_type:complete
MIKKEYKVVISCGGFGTRIKNVTKDIPKPLFPINGKSTLERCIEQLSKYKLDSVLITVGFKNELFYDAILNLREKYKISIDIYKEEFPLGECGALWCFKNKLSDQFIFINGDLIFSIDFDRLIYFHKRLSSNLTLVTHTSDHPEDSDLVSTPNGVLVEDIFFKNSQTHIYKNAYLGNSGIFLINKKLLEIIKAPLSKDSKSIFHFLVKNTFNLNINIYSYNTTEYIKDMGTPNRLGKVTDDLFNNIVSNKNYQNFQKALFLDRDNTLIKCDIGKYILEKSEISLIEQNIIKIINIAKNYNFVCLLTNQPSISMGKLTIKELDNINSSIVKKCLSMGLKIDIITYCPHHPHSGFEGEIPFLKKDCFCRKPNPGLFFEQAFLRNINLNQSLMIGDSENDLIAAKNAGCKFINVNKL